MKFLIDRGHEVSAICPAGELSGEFSKFGVKHYSYFMDRKSFNPLKEMVSVYEIRKILAKIRPDLLHSFIAKPNIYGCFAARFFPGLKVVCSVTGLGSFFLPGNVSGKTRIIELLYKLALKRANNVIFQNDDDRGFFSSEKLCSSQKTVLIRGSGVDTDKFSPASHRKVGGQLKIGMVARLSTEKGVWDFLRAAEILKKEFNCRFQLIGWPDFGNPGSITEEEFLKLQENPAVEVLGFQKDVLDFLQNFDIYCLPSYREGLPMSVLEAMSCGLPIITTDVPGCRETVENGINGYLVEPKNTESLVGGLRRLLSDPASRIRMGRESRKKVENEFSLGYVVKHHENLYKRLLGKI
jgi:N,N'-diacetylbacillosaminyl-diphospho-undecaprenol alpha-1,3-N-acetylgalactosaminyltransferase